MIDRAQVTAVDTNLLRTPQRRANRDLEIE
jgi:hypothetical protein